MIHFEQVTKKYPNGQIAISDIDLKIEDGEFVFLVGPSGAGKTTLLRLFTREVWPTAGRILFNGEDILKIPPSKFHI